MQRRYPTRYQSQLSRQNAQLLRQDQYQKNPPGRSKEGNGRSGNGRQPMRTLSYHPGRNVRNVQAQNQREPQSRNLAKQTQDLMVLSLTPEKESQEIHFNDDDEQSSTQRPHPQANLSPKFDRRFAEDELTEPQYIKSIMKHLFETEMKYHPDPQYMSKQRDINKSMRCILIDWLIDVHSKFGCSREALYLAVMIIDRVLSKWKITKRNLQLVGVTSLYLAAKYEDIYIPEVKEIVWVCAYSYDKQTILKMERHILALLDFSLTHPTIYSFMQRFLHVIEAHKTLKEVCYYLTELCILRYETLKHKPSVIAASCVLLGERLFSQFVRKYLPGKPDLQIDELWGKSIQHYSGYKLDDLRPCVAEVLEYAQKQRIGAYKASKNKYSKRRHMQAAVIVAKIIKEF